MAHGRHKVCLAALATAAASGATSKAAFATKLPSSAGHLRTGPPGVLIARRVGAKPARGRRAGSTPPPGFQQPKHVKKSASALSASVPDMSKEQLPTTMRAGARTAAQWGLGACGALAGLVGLLYITHFFESIIHSSSGLQPSTSPLVAAITGLAVGALHTVSGPDHLAALAPLVVGQRRSPAKAFGLGALWGSGHATGQLLLGLACLAVQVGVFKAAWGPTLSHFSSLFVGMSLVVIGCLGMYEARDYEDGHSESHEDEKSRFGWATYATGVVHGFSPDALIFLAPALALPRLAATIHVTGVALGTLVSMGGCTALLSAVCRRNPRVKSVSFVAASVAILLGLSIIAAFFGLTVPLPGL